MAGETLLVETGEPPSWLSWLERRSHNPEVASSILADGKRRFHIFCLSASDLIRAYDDFLFLDWLEGDGLCRMATTVSVLAERG